MADILINGTLKNNTKSGTIAYANQIQVEPNKTQADVNLSFNSRLEALESSGGGGGSSDNNGLSNRISNLEKGLGVYDSFLNYPKGKLVHLLNKDRLATRNIYSSTSDLRLFFFSDIHGDSEAWERIIQLANAWKLEGYIDAVLNGGDIVESVLANGYTWYNNGIGNLNVPLLTILGNHDRKIDAQTNANESTSYNALMDVSMTQLERLLGSSNVFHTGTKSYYYVDFDSNISTSNNKIRIIALNCMLPASGVTSWDSEELQWLTNTLEDARTNDYYVIILNHSSPGGSNVHIIDSNFSNTNVVYNVSSWPIEKDAITAVKNFIDNDGKFICWLCGHTHMDYFVYPYYDNTIYDKQPMFITSCAAWNKGWTAPYRTSNENDVFRDSFNYITIDIARGIFRIIRIGKNYDERMISKTYMTYDFVHHRLLPSDKEVKWNGTTWVNLDGTTLS